MQTILQKGKNYLKIDISYLFSFVVGVEYDLVLTKRDCQTVKVIASTTQCGTYAILEFNLVGCLSSTGIWSIAIYEKDTQNILHKIKVQVS